ncbi:MAG: cation transporting ATPase C-terminal domain-containing protein, partial [Cyanobium sp.]
SAADADRLVAATAAARGLELSSLETYRQLIQVDLIDGPRAAEMLPFLAMLTLAIPAALTVLQILAVDLGTDLLPALALGAEPPEAGCMQRPPRQREEPLLSRAVVLGGYLLLGAVEAGLAMAAYLLAWLGWMLPVPVLVVLVDDLRKWLLAGRPQRCSISSLAG